MSPSIPLPTLPSSVACLGLEGSSGIFLRLLASKKYWMVSDLEKISSFLDVPLERVDKHLQVLEACGQGPLVKKLDGLWVVQSSLNRELNN